ncbi:MAG: pyridoxamine 5'-phosphate oxidase family protein [Clostridiales bacterium]|nr:pyridoxamine 5'-phosphate oxidase family protein [Clostridiales bacterium]
MRRKDREITKKEQLLSIVNNCKVCRLGLAVADKPYIVPLNFGYIWEENESLKLYFHSAKEGLKLDMLAKNNLACFEMDGGHKLIRKENPGDFSYAYYSIIGWGSLRIIHAAEEKHHALCKLMEHQAGFGKYCFSETDLAKVTVLCLEAEEITGKGNNWCEKALFSV